MRRYDPYPIGQQSFQVLREGGALYVDKTMYVDSLVNSQSKYYFLARPRRFGKSLFLSTLKCFFEGKRELFKGLFIDSTDWEWQPYPVLHLDFNTQRYSDHSDLDSVLSNTFKDWEREYSVTDVAENFSERFENIIKAAHENTGKQVVILVDEYDKPLVNNLNNDDDFEFFRKKLASIYSNFKSSADHIKLAFLTGVSRFSRLSVFSDLNNLRDISFMDEYSGICGISEEEVHQYFEEGITEMAHFNSETYKEASQKLKENYDGYQFSKFGKDMYNPWSLLNALSSREIANYWNMTGMPTIIAESLKRINADLEKSLNVKCSFKELVGLDLRSPQPTALLYQTGYITIKDYDKTQNMFTLGIPNNEVKEGLFDILIPYYINTKTNIPEELIYEFVYDLTKGCPEAFMKRLEAYFASIPFKLRISNEHDLRNAIYIFMSLLGIKVHAELETSDGAIDITIKTPDYIYIIELKYNKSAQAAIDQIREKDYPLPFATDSRKVYLIGANFNSRKRRFDDIIVE